MGLRYGDITKSVNAVDVEAGEPSIVVGSESGELCPAGRTEAFWYIGLNSTSATATVQPWLFSPTRNKWYFVGDPLSFTGSQIIQVYANGKGGRTFMQITAGSQLPATAITRDVQFLVKEA